MGTVGRPRLQPNVFLLWTRTRWWVEIRRSTGTAAEGAAEEAAAADTDNFHRLQSRSGCSSLRADRYNHAPVAVEVAEADRCNFRLLSWRSDCSSSRLGPCSRRPAAADTDNSHHQPSRRGCNLTHSDPCNRRTAAAEASDTDSYHPPPSRSDCSWRRLGPCSHKPDPAHKHNTRCRTSNRSPGCTPNLI